MNPGGIILSEPVKVNPEFNVVSLVELQLTESSILRKQNEINNLRRNEKLLKLLSEIGTEKKQLDELDKALRSVEHERKKLEDIVAVHNEKIKKNEEKLFSGTITSAKELVNYQEEIKSLKQNNDELENKILEKMMEIDEYRVKIKDLSSKIAQLDSEISSLKGDIEGKIKIIEVKIKNLKDKKSAVVSIIPKEYLLKYEALKNKKGGIAVAVLKNEFCDICNMQIPSGDAEKIKDISKVHKCPLCGRMLIIHRKEIDKLKADIE
jgi:predicted  nucleic acid-binding Zn-ribbon protein